MSKFDEITKMLVKERQERENRVEKTLMTQDEFEYMQEEREKFYENPMSEKDMRDRENQLPPMDYDHNSENEYNPYDPKYYGLFDNDDHMDSDPYDEPSYDASDYGFEMDDF